MQKRSSLLLLAAIGSLFLMGSHAVEQPDFTREQELATRNGAFVVEAGIWGLYIVSVANRSIGIKPVNPGFKPCKDIPIDPFEDVIEGELRATFLNRRNWLQRKLIVWGIRGTQSSSINPNRTVVSYTMLLIDPKQCQSKALWLPDEEIDSSQPMILPRVELDWEISPALFYIFYASQRQCSPCVFDSYGKSQSIERSLEPEGAVPASPFYLHPLNPVDNNFGYFYAYNFVDSSSVVKLLDINYQTKRLKRFHHAVDAVSVRSGRIRNVGYCYKALDSPNELHCDRLDSRLQAVISVLVPLDQPARKVLLDYDEQGNFFVAVVLPSEVRVFVYEIFGKLLATLDFGQLQDTQRVRDFSNYIQDKQYCLFYSVTEQQQASWASDANNVLKCILTTKYIN